MRQRFPIDARASWCPDTSLERCVQRSGPRFLCRAKVGVVGSGVVLATGIALAVLHVVPRGSRLLPILSHSWYLWSTNDYSKVSWYLECAVVTFSLDLLQSLVYMRTSG